MLMNCTIYAAKTKALISCAVTMQLICAFVFAYAKSGFLMHSSFVTYQSEKSIQVFIVGVSLEHPDYCLNKPGTIHGVTK